MEDRWNFSLVTWKAQSRARSKSKPAFNQSPPRERWPFCLTASSTHSDAITERWPGYHWWEELPERSWSMFTGLTGILTRRISPSCVLMKRGNTSLNTRAGQFFTRLQARLGPFAYHRKGTWSHSLITQFWATPAGQSGL